MELPAQRYSGIDLPRRGLRCPLSWGWSAVTGVWLPWRWRPSLSGCLLTEPKLHSEIVLGLPYSSKLVSKG